MEYYLYGAAFVAGVVLMGLAARQRLKFLLKDEWRSYRKEVRKKLPWWRQGLFPEIPVLKRHKDHYKKKADKLQLQLEEEAIQVEKQALRIRDLQREMEELRRENRELNTIVTTPSGAKTGVTSFRGSAPADRISRPVPLEEEVVYFGIPDHEGQFPADRGEPQNDNRKLFKIVMKPKSDKGELHYLSGELDLKAINNIDYYLVPVCEIANIAGRNTATRVVQEEKGHVSLVAGKWVCTSKVKIKLV
jgi:hypothetical protein